MIPYKTHLDRFYFLEAHLHAFVPLVEKVIDDEIRVTWQQHSWMFTITNPANDEILERLANDGRNVGVDQHREDYHQIVRHVIQKYRESGYTVTMTDTRRDHIAFNLKGWDP